MKRLISLMLAIVMVVSMIPTAVLAEEVDSVKIYDLKVNDLVSPLGLDQNPVFSWKMASNTVGQCQTAYQVVVADNAELTNPVWDSGKVESGLSVSVDYAGSALQASTVYFWQVTVWDKDGTAVKSSVEQFETGLLTEDAWNDVQFISVGEEPDPFHYTVEADIRCTSKAAGLLFGALDESNMYMWQLNINDGTNVYLNPHKCVSGVLAAWGDSINVTAACTSVENVKNNGVRMLVDITPNAITTYLDGTLVDTRAPLDSVPTATIGKIGVRTSGSSEKGYYDNLLVTDYTNDENGKTVVSYTFDDGVNPFTALGDGGTCEIQSGELYAYKSLLALDELFAFAGNGYTLEFDAKCEKNNAAILFGGLGNTNFYMWQFSIKDTGTSVKLTPHHYLTAMESVTIPETVLTAEAFASGFAHIKIHVTEDLITTYVNGTQVDSRAPLAELSTAVIGKVGVRATAAEIMHIDNIVLTDLAYSEDGRTVLNYTFDDGVNPFAYGQIQDGVLYCNATGTASPYAALDTTTEFPTLVAEEETYGTPSFRKDIVVKEGLVSARLYSTALGAYDAFINGVRVGHLQADGTTVYDELKPGTTETQKRKFYYTNDVTHLLTAGQTNTLSAWVTTGWWNGAIMENRGGVENAFAAKLVLTYSDGTREIVNTDTTWQAAYAGPMIFADIYAGETYDATQSTDWMQPDFTDWNSAKQNTEYTGIVMAHIGPKTAVRQDLTRTPVDLYTYTKGNVTGKEDLYHGTVIRDSTYTASQEITLAPGQVLIADMGQNFAGWEKFTVSGEKGTTLTVRHGELLNDENGMASGRGNDGPEGSLNTSNLAGAEATTTYILGGTGDETYQPSMTYYGFRYVEFTCDKTVTLSNISGQVVTSVTGDSGSIVTSNAKVNQLISNTRWSQYSNYLYVPTDCPNRDERYGWAGDAQAFSITGAYNSVDTKPFLQKWLMDYRDVQFTDPSSEYYGANYSNAPRSRKTGSIGRYGWNDATVIIPYNMWMMTGDTGILEEHYDSMQLYVDQWLGSTDKKGGDNGYGDWLSAEGNDDVLKAILGVAYYAWDAMLMSEMAAALGKTEDAAKYQALYETEKEYFIEKFVNEDGSLVSDMQAAALHALYLDLLPDENSRQVVKQALLDNFKRNGDHLQTGFLGTSIILKALSEADLTDQAYRLLLQNTYPSWLYPVENGATTIFECWDSYTKEYGLRRFTGNRSLNHYNNGCVVEWIYRYAAGIDFDESTPGFKHIVLAPEPSRMLESVDASYDSVYGTIESSWKYQGAQFTYSATIPANTTATVKVPVETLSTLTVNGKAYTAVTTADDGIVFTGEEDGVAVFEAVAGSFAFATSVADETYLTVSTGESFGIPGKVSVNGGDYVPMTGLVKVNKGEEVKLVAKSANDLDYAVSAWRDASGNVLSTDAELTYVPTQNATLYVDFEWVGKQSLAEGAAVTVSSQRTTTRYLPENLTDGVYYHAYSPSCCWSSAQVGTDVTLTETVTAVVDLGQSTTMDVIRLYPATEGIARGKPIGMPVDYVLSVSSDNAEWTPVATVTDGEADCWKPAVITLDAPVSAQYVKLEVTKVSSPYYNNYGEGTTWVQVAELGVYNTALENTFTVEAGETFGMDGQIKIGDGEWQSLPASFVLDGEEVTLQARHANAVDYGVDAWKDADGKILGKKSTLTLTAESSRQIMVDFGWRGYQSIAKDATVTGNKYEVSGTWQINYLADGKLTHLDGNNGWLSANMTSSVDDTGAFTEPVEVTIDLGRSRNIDAFKLYPRTDVLTDDGEVYCFPVDYTISVSSDNSAWTTLCTVEGGDVSAWTPVVHTVQEDVSAQYVKLSVTKVNRPDNNGKYWVQVSELGVYDLQLTYTSQAEAFSGLQLKVSVPQYAVPGGSSAVVMRSFSDGRSPVAVTVPMEKWESADGYYVIPCVGVDYKSVCDTVTVTLQDADCSSLGEVWSGTLQQSMLEGLGGWQNDVELAALNLCNAAQTFFDYSTDSPAAGTAAEQIAALAETYAEKLAEIRKDSSKAAEGSSLIYGTSCLLEGDLKMNVYFYVDPSKYTFSALTFTLNGESVSPEAVGQNYYCACLEVLPWQITDTVTIRVLSGETVLASAEDSVASYCARLYARGGNDAALADAILLLGMTSKEIADEYADVTLDLCRDETSYKAYGRMYEGENGLAVTYPGSGVEFDAQLLGNITMTYTADDGCWLQVFLNGEAQPRVHADEGSATITLVKDLEPGDYNVRIIRDSDVFTLNDDAFEVSSISLRAKDGAVTAPENKDLYIEFVGDSITSGQGALVEYLVTDSEGALKIATKDADDPSHSATHSYAYLTAQLLDADWHMLSRGGMGYFKTSTLSHKTVDKIYPYYNGYMSQPIAFTHERQADIAVLALSTNDYDDDITNEAIENGTVPYASKQEAVQWLVDAVRAQHGEDVKVVIIYNMMLSNSNFVDAFTAVQQANENIFLLQTTRNKEGGSDHPSAAGHAVIAQELADFITGTVLK